MKICMLLMKQHINNMERDNREVKFHKRGRHLINN